jgi:adenine/guanine phosphoribosyltransferase-like PRPP-binding protein
MAMYTGYSGWKYDRGLLRAKLGMLLPTIQLAALETDAGCLIVSGTSGVWLGAMLTMEQDLPVVLVRKDGENSHGSIVEGDTAAKTGLVVDDFISTGATINRIARSLSSWGAGLKVVGVIEHCRTGDRGWGPTVCVDPESGVMSRYTVPVFSCDYAEIR